MTSFLLQNTQKRLTYSLSKLSPQGKGHTIGQPPQV